MTGSVSERGKSGNHSSLFDSYTKAFEEFCPHYLNAGMSYEQFWDGDCEMVKAFRKAHELKLEEDNFKAWLQGKYVYDAFCFVSPILRAFSKAKKPIDYLEQPYSLKTEYSEVREKQRQKDSDAKAKDMLTAFAIEFNKKFAEKGGISHG